MYQFKMYRILGVLLILVILSSSTTALITDVLVNLVGLLLKGLTRNPEGNTVSYVVATVGGISIIQTDPTTDDVCPHFGTLSLPAGADIDLSVVDGVTNTVYGGTTIAGLTVDPRTLKLPLVDTIGTDVGSLLVTINPSYKIYFNMTLKHSNFQDGRNQVAIPDVNFYIQNGRQDVEIKPQRNKPVVVYDSIYWEDIIYENFRMGTNQTLIVRMKTNDLNKNSGNESNAEAEDIYLDLDSFEKAGSNLATFTLTNGAVLSINSNKVDGDPFDQC